MALVHPGPPLRQRPTDLIAGLGSGRGGHGHLAVCDLDLRAGELKPIHRGDRRGGRGRGRRVSGTGAGVDGGNHRDGALGLRDGCGVGHDPVDDRPAGRQVRGVKPMPGLGGRGHRDGYLAAIRHERGLAVVDLIGVRDASDHWLRRSGGVHRADAGGHIRNRRRHDLGAGRLGDGGRVGEGAVAIRGPPGWHILVVDLLAGLGGGDHGHSHLVPILDDFRLGVGDAIGRPGHNRRL